MFKRTWFIIIAILTFPSLAFAQNNATNGAVTVTGNVTSTSLLPPFGTAASQSEPIVIIATIIQALLGITGACALLVFVWGGLHMIFSGGSEEKVTKGRNALLWAVIGLLVILSSYAVLSFTFGLFKTATGG